MNNANALKKYQALIFDGLARMLWTLAYADWVENRDEEEGEEGEGYEGDVGRPGPGGNWENYTPETPLGALQAAHELGDLIADANGLVRGRRGQAYPLSELFLQAMEIHLGHSVLDHDEPWHSQIVDDPSDRELRSVYADWLEENGRLRDAEFVRRASVDQINFTGYLHEAKRFGQDLAFMALGHGVSWADNHVTKREGGLVFDPEMPYFECHYDGEHLKWSGRVMEKDPEQGRDGRTQGSTQTRYQGPDEPTLTEQFGEDLSSYGKRQIIVVNANDQSWTKHSFVLWFGQFSPTLLMIYANSLDDALDEGIDWLVDNEPGQIVDDQVQEEFKRLEAEYMEENNIVDRPLDDAELGPLYEQAEADTTSGGNASNRINSDAWGIEAEDPSPTDLLRIAGLTNNPPQQNGKKKPPKSDWDELASVMFKDSVTARMLRELAEKKEMPQAEFMRHYQTRCERATRLPRYAATPPSIGEGRQRYDGSALWTPGQKPGMSGFMNNFGTYVNRADWHGSWPWRGFGYMAGFAPGTAGSRPTKVIEQGSIPAKSKNARPSRNLLKWIGPSIADLVKNMTPAMRDWAHQSLERQLLEPRETDDPAETARWIEWLRSGYAPNPAPSRSPACGRQPRHYRPVGSQVTHGSHPVPRKR